MAVPGAALLEILDRTLEGRGAGGIAVVSAAVEKTDAVWRPASSRDEPGYLAYSITKTFIATVMLQLRDAQRLSLDDPRALPPRLGLSRRGGVHPVGDRSLPRCAVLPRSALVAVASGDDDARLVRRRRGGRRVALAKAGLWPRRHRRSGISVGAAVGSQRRRTGLLDQRVSRARRRGSVSVRDVLGRRRCAGGSDRLRGARRVAPSTVKTAAYSSRGSLRAKRPLRRSSSVCSISARVFITKGP